MAFAVLCHRLTVACCAWRQQQPNRTKLCAAALQGCRVTWKASVQSMCEITLELGCRLASMQHVSYSAFQLFEVIGLIGMIMSGKQKETMGWQTVVETSNTW